MLDVKLLRDDLARVKERMATRGTTVDWDEFARLDQQRRDALANIERLKEKKNRLSGEIGKLKKSTGDASAPMREVEDVSAAIRDSEAPLAEIEARFEQFMLSIPNLPSPTVTIGKNEHDNREVRRWSEPPKFDFPAKNHWDIGEELAILDFVRAAKMVGRRGWDLVINATQKLVLADHLEAGGIGILQVVHDPQAAAGVPFH